MCTLWENYSGCDLELRKYISRISDSILQRMHAGWYPGLWSERAQRLVLGRNFDGFHISEQFYDELMVPQTLQKCVYAF